MGEVFQCGNLVYAGHDCQWIPDQVIGKYGATAVTVDFSENKLINLSELSQFSRLKEIVLDKNNIDDVIIWTLPCLPNLEALSLNKNIIRDLDNFLDIMEMRTPGLKYLSLHGNPLCPDQLTSADNDETDYKRYRLYTKYRLPTLKALDHKPFNSLETTKASIKGPYLKTVRPKAILQQNLHCTHEDVSPCLRPLPANTANTSSVTKSSFSKCDYVYLGKHSQGNRFIRSKDL